MSYFYGYPYDSGYAFYTQGPPPPPQGKSQKIMYMVNILFNYLWFSVIFHKKSSPKWTETVFWKLKPKNTERNYSEKKAFFNLFLENLSIILVINWI